MRDKLVPEIVFESYNDHRRLVTEWGWVQAKVAVVLESIDMDEKLVLAHERALFDGTSKGEASHFNVNLLKAAYFYKYTRYIIGTPGADMKYLKYTICLYLQTSGERVDDIFTNLRSHRVRIRIRSAPLPDESLYVVTWK